MGVTIDNVLTERGSRYGRFVDNAKISQGLKKVVESDPNWSKLPVDAREGIHNIFAKISRIMTGDPTYVDNWVDIEGYARLVREELERNAAIHSQSFDVCTFIEPVQSDGPSNCENGDP